MMIEKYNMNIPRMTDAEKAKISSVVELYTCIQSEGSRAGRPTVAVRTTGCTHRCYFGEGGWCDSWYTSIHPEKARYSFNDIIKIYNENPEIKEMMLTGGSPTMHPKLVNELTHFAHERDIIITIETEGSHFIQTDYPIGLISFSPKFSNSIPKLGVLTPNGKVVDEKFIAQHNKLRLNKDAIIKSIEYHNDYHMKVVINPVEDLETWIEIRSFMDELNIPKEKIWIMPPGDNRKELIRVYPMVIEWCTKNHYNFTGREHIIAFDVAREV
mgnify:CR=1 FL=1